MKFFKRRPLKSILADKSYGSRQIHLLQVRCFIERPVSYGCKALRQHHFLNEGIIFKTGIGYLCYPFGDVNNGSIQAGGAGQDAGFFCVIENAVHYGKIRIPVCNRDGFQRVTVV